ncbi:hypothetical protein CHARACLAT_012764 [Characodon lateralis]|uniref:Uncharacterized protein n=1 Tax=Characodon lateralis TaxID=208331 RepID=A0ABU7EJ63_9TELE|nr:hypothetical protein [Characodon lateralis]
MVDRLARGIERRESEEEQVLNGHTVVTPDQRQIMSCCLSLPASIPPIAFVVLSHTPTPHFNSGPIGSAWTSRTEAEGWRQQGGRGGNRTAAGCKVTSGEQIGSLLELEGEVQSHSPDQQQASVSDLSASMATHSDSLASHSSPVQMMDSGLLGTFSGFSQPGGIGMNVEVGTAPLQPQKLPSVSELQYPSPRAGSDIPKDHSAMLPEPHAPLSPLDVSAGKTL